MLGYMLKLFSKKPLVFSTAAIALGGIGYLIFSAQQQINLAMKPITVRSLPEILPYYGFSTPEQQQALTLLMQAGGILQANLSLSDRFPVRNTPDELLKDLLKWVQAVQETFVIRKNAQERWEVKTPSWLEGNDPMILNAIQTLGLTQAIKPHIQRPDVLCILGATYYSMKNRLHYAETLLNGSLSPKHLVLLAGERYVTVGVDGDQALLQKIAADYGINIHQLTETHLIRTLYKQTHLSPSLAVTVIDTPKGTLPRPTTETTVLQLGQWLKQHPEYKSVVFVSNQPHVGYQSAVIQNAVEQQDNLQPLQIEVIGSEASVTRLDGIIGALGSMIWAKTPAIIATLHLTTTNPELQQLQETLYASQPLIYQKLKR